VFRGPAKDSDKPWWIDEFIRPINADLQAGNEEGARQTMAMARMRLTSGELDNDNARALTLFLLFLEFKSARLRLDELNTPALFDRARLELAAPPQGPVAALTSSMLLLELLVNGHHLGLYELSQEEFRKRFDAVPAAGRTHHFWYYTSGYAFIMGDEAIVTEAYKLYLVNPSGSADYYTVQRLKLMLHLMQGKAGKKDVLELLKRIQTLPQISEFNLVFYPRIESAGLVDEEVLSACAEKEGEILTQGPIYMRQDKDAAVFKPRYKVNI
jgi:hypothetical protein